MTQPSPPEGITLDEALPGITASQITTAADGVRKDAAAAYRELAGIVLAEAPLGATLTRIASSVQESLDGADDVSITLIQNGRPRTVAFSSESKLAASLDERQYADGYGPCLDAAVTGRTIAIDDTSDCEFYPDFARLARREGVGHTLSVGLPTLQEVQGGLNIYGFATSPVFSPQARTVAAGFAGYVAVALTNAALYAGAVDEVAQMQQAMASRAVIEQAKGMLMRDHGCDEEAAFAMLRELSMRSNSKLRTVAESIVAGATG